MRGSDFAPLYQGLLSARLVWEASHPCPCSGPDGVLEEVCPICEGRGVYHDPPSAPFRGGLISLSARALEAISQRFGPGVVGDATASLPENAPCWASIGAGDRLAALDAQDTLSWQLVPNRLLHLPFGAVPVSATIRDQQGVLREIPPPLPDTRGRVGVAAPTVLRFVAPRRFEVVRDLSQVRAFGTGLPKKVLLRLLDVSVR